MWNWEKGKYVGDNLSWLTIEKYVHKGANRRVRVRSDDGTIRRISSTEILIETMFREGIQGNIKMNKLAFRYAKKHLHGPQERKDNKQEPTVHAVEITQDYVDEWKASGSLPAGCSDVLGEISLLNLNKAFKTYQKKCRAEIRDAVKILEQEPIE